MTQSCDMLAGTKVIELQFEGAPDYVPVQFAGKLLSFLGADVEIVPVNLDSSGRESSGSGYRTHPSMQSWLSSGKHHGSLEDGNREAVARGVVGHQSDLVLLGGNGATGLAEFNSLITALRAASSALRIVCVTPFGLYGTKAGWRGSNLVSLAAGGAAFYTPWVVEPQSERPLQLSQYGGDLVAGAAAVVCAMEQLCGSGEASFGDVSSQDAVVAMMLLNMAWYTHELTPPSRSKHSGRGGRAVPLRCRDGLFSLLTPQQAQWERWVEVMGSPNWASEPVFATRSLRDEHRDAIDLLIEEWARDFTKEEIWRLGQKFSVPVFPVNTIDEVIASPQMQSRGYFGVSDGAAGVIPGNPYRGASRVSTSRSTPDAWPAMSIEGLRVLDLSWVLAAPRATSWLGYLGADVIRVESRHRLDQFRTSAPYWRGSARSPDDAGSFHHINQNKRSICVDLTHPDAAELILKLVEGADVLIQSFAVGQMERFGLTESEIRKRKPDLIYASSSGLGSTGPDARTKAYGNVIHAYAGLTARVGYAPRDIRGVNGTWADPLTGSILAGTILAAVHYRNRTGFGVSVDLSMAEIVACATIPDAFLDARGAQGESLPENSTSVHFLSDTFRCHDDEDWIAITLWDQDDASRLASALGTTIANAASAEEVRGTVTQLVRRWSAADLTEKLQREGIAAHKVFSVVDVIEDGHCRARGSVATVTDALGRQYPVAALPWRTWRGNDLVTRPHRAAPRLGEHTDEVLGTALGLTEDDLAGLRRANLLS